MSLKKLLIIISFLIVLCLASGYVFAQDEQLEETYPAFPGSPKIISYLPNYIRYAYMFIVISGGLLALGSLIMGGMRYITSAGNPSIMNDAKSQIISAFIGLVVLLGSYIVLGEISPETLELNPPTLTAAGQGIIIYTDDNCGDGSNSLPGQGKPLQDIRYLRVESAARVGDEDFGVAFPVGSFYTFNSSEEITIEFYSNNDCRTGFIRRIPDDNLSNFGAKECINPGNTIQPVKCVKIIWHKPGVYLYTYEDGNPKEMVPAGETFKIYQNSVGGLPNSLNDKVRSIALVHEKGTQYGVVLTNTPKTGLRDKDRGWAHVYIPQNESEEVTLFNTANKDVGSLILFKLNRDAVSSDITICRNADCLWQENHPAAVTFSWDGHWEREEADGSKTTGDDGLDEITGLPADIVRGVSIGRTAGGAMPESTDFDGLWWDGDPDEAIVQDGAHNIAFLGGKGGRGMSALTFDRPNASYLAILYDRRDGATDGSVNNNVLCPNGDALIRMSNAPDLSMNYYDNVTGSILLIKIK